MADSEKKKTVDEKVVLDTEGADYLNITDSIEVDSNTLSVPDLAPQGVIGDVQEVKSPKKNKKLILGGALAGLLVLIALAVLFFLPDEAEKKEPVAEGPKIVIVSDNPADAPVVKQPKIISLEPFWIELDDPKGGDLFLTCQFSIISKNDNLEEEIKQKKAIFRDAVYFYLKGRPRDFLLNPHNATQIKKDISSVLEGYLRWSDVDSTIFESYVSQ